MFFASIVKSKISCIISGGTSVGKTTFLNLMLSEVKLTERIILIEDTRELTLSIPNIVRLESIKKNSKESLVTTRDLVKNSLSY